MILPVAGLVAERPAENARMAAVAHHHPFGTRHDGVAPAGIAAEGGVIRMRFKICLVENVDAVLVAEIVPAVVVGIVAGADRIVIELLHHADVADHGLQGEGLPGPAVVFMPVHALDENASAVEQKVAPLQTDVPEADPFHAAVQQLAFRAEKFHGQKIEIRLLGRPGFHVRKAGGLLAAVAAPTEFVADDGVVFPDLLSVGGAEPGRDREILFRSVRQKGRKVHAKMRLHGKESVSGLQIQIPVGEEILKIDRSRRIKIDAPVDARHPPLVLILDIAGVGPADHFADQRVASGIADRRRQIELRGKTRILPHADELAVQIDFQITLRSSDVNHNPTILPGIRKTEGRPVDARRILLRNHRGIVLKRHLGIGVNGFVETAAQRPVGRNRDSVPFLILQFRIRKIRGHILRSLEKTEFSTLRPATGTTGNLCGRASGHFPVRVGNFRSVGGNPVICVISGVRNNSLETFHCINQHPSFFSSAESVEKYIRLPAIFQAGKKRIAGKAEEIERFRMHRPLLPRLLSALFPFFSVPGADPLTGVPLQSIETFPRADFMAERRDFASSAAVLTPGSALSVCVCAAPSAPIPAGRPDADAPSPVLRKTPRLPRQKRNKLRMAERFQPLLRLFGKKTALQKAIGQPNRRRRFIHILPSGSAGTPEEFLFQLLFRRKRRPRFFLPGRHQSSGSLPHSFR